MVSDGQDPTAEVRAVSQPGIRAQRGQPGLLIAVVGIDAADGGHEEAVHVTAVGIEQLLEGWELHRD